MDNNIEKKVFIYTVKTQKYKKCFHYPDIELFSRECPFAIIFHFTSTNFIKQVGALCKTELP
jgi:hypothetical protein